MYTIENNQVTFRYLRSQLHQRVQQLSAQLSLTMLSPNPDVPASDLFAVTEDETLLMDELLMNSAVTAADEFDKIGQFEATDESFAFSAPCPDSFAPHAPKADVHLQEWITWHCLTRWFRLRHQDKTANWTLMQATVAFSALHRDLFCLR